MIRAPNDESSPFRRVQCPFVTRRACGRPYCPFGHREEDVPATTANDQTASSSKLIPPTVNNMVEIRQENPTATFSGGYMGYVSSNFATPTQNFQQFEPHHSFTTPSAYGDTSYTITTDFQSRAAAPPYAMDDFEINPTPLELRRHHQNPTIVFQPPLATSTQFSQFPINSTPFAPPAMMHKRPKPAPGGLPAYIPTPIAQLEKEQQEREERRERREEEKQRKREERERQTVIEKETAQQKKAKTAMTAQKKTKPAADGAGLDIDRLLADQEHLLDEMTECPERKLQEIQRVEAELEQRRQRLAEQRPSNKKGITLKSSAPLQKSDSLEIVESAEIPQKKKSDKETKKSTKTKKKSSEEKKSPVEKHQNNEEKPKKRDKNSNSAEKKKKVSSSSTEKQPRLNDCVKNVAKIDKEIQKLRREISQSNDKLVVLGGKIPLQKPKISDQSGTKISMDPQQKSEKRTPIWRRSEPKLSTNPFDDDRLYMSTQAHALPKLLREGGETSKKSLAADPLLSELFGEEEGGETRKKKKEAKKRKTSGGGGGGEPSSSSAKKAKKRHKKIEEEDEEVRRERQALIDLISEGSDEDESPHLQADQHKIPAANKPSTSAINQNQKKIRPPSPALSSSSVSVVPETPPSASPEWLQKPTMPKQRSVIPSAKEQLVSRTIVDLTKAHESKDAKKAEKNNQKSAVTSKTPNFVPLRVTQHPSQRPAAPKRRDSVASDGGGATTSNNTSSAAPAPSSLFKDTTRKAHAPKFPTPALATKKLVLLDPENRKVPLAIRQRQLAAIHAEYVKICKDDEPDRAVEGAQHEEHAVLERCNGKMGYLAAIPMLIKRLREVAAGKAEEAHRRMPGESVSHSSMLLGRHAGFVTCGLHRADKIAQHKSTHLSELDFYNALQSTYLLSAQLLWENGYPRWANEEIDEEDEDEGMGLEERPGRLVEIRQSELDKNRTPFVDDNVLSRVCDRCGREYRLTKEGDYAAGASTAECIYHWGRAWKKRTSGAIESRYTCCDQPLSEAGCVVGQHHVTQSLRRSTLRRYVPSPRPFGVGDPRSKKVYALDCEMVYTVWGPEVARLSVVDIVGELILDVLIRPEHRLVDCNTRFSGLKPEQVLAGECDLKEAQQRLFELVNSETILIGHSLESDLRAMRLVHERVVDTSVIFPHRMGPPLKRALKTLAAEIIQLIIQEDATGHDSKEDALACMRIMLRKVRGN